MSIKLNGLRGAIWVCALALAIFGPAGLAAAQVNNEPRESYNAAIWIDPDGCEHWVMDDGFEGFMTPHLTRDGIPVCRPVRTCAIVRNEHLFATNSAKVGSSGRKWLNNFFRQDGVSSYIIVGHTDNVGSDEDNIRLSGRRASAVAEIARENRALISGVRAFGERKPRASNDTKEGRQKNRRVEILCVR